MEAYYLLGCVYRDLGEAPNALSVFHDAVDFADTTDIDCDYALLSRVHAQMADLLEKIQFGLHPTFSLYYEFCVLGCQGDRMPMYRAFAPFFEGDKGDRRVTGVCVHNQERASEYWFAPPRMVIV